MLRKLLAVMVLALGAHGAALAQQLEVKREGAVTLPATMREIVFKSPAAAGREYMVRIVPPMIPVPEGEKAAVVYVLDGNLYFGVAESTLRLMSLENGSWPTYMVAIGYDTAAGADVMTTRAHDFLHKPARGGADSEGSACRC